MSDDIFNSDDVDVLDCLKPGLVKKKETHFGTIYLDLSEGTTYLRQRWKVEFIIEPGATPLTYQQRVDYYWKLRSEIWTDWNSRRPLPNVPGATTDATSRAIAQLLNSHDGVLFKVAGTSDFARKFGDLGSPIDVDISLHRHAPHWHVKVFRPKPGDEGKAKYRDSVTDATRHITLNYANTEPHEVCNEGRPQVCQTGFLTPPHEFGHTFFADDEYIRGSRFIKDTNSIMNIGREVRARHYRWIVQQLNTMLPHTRFSLPPN
jgi:hypothetical protein